MLTYLFLYVWVCLFVLWLCWHLSICSLVLIEIFCFVQVIFFLLVEEFTLLRIHSRVENEASYLCLVFDATASVPGLLLVYYSLVSSFSVRSLNKFPLGLKAR